MQIMQVILVRAVKGHGSLTEGSGALQPEVYKILSLQHLPLLGRTLSGRRWVACPQMIEGFSHYQSTSAVGIPERNIFGTAGALDEQPPGVPSAVAASSRSRRPRNPYPGAYRSATRATYAGVIVPEEHVLVLVHPISLFRRALDSEWNPEDVWIIHDSLHTFMSRMCNHSLFTSVTVANNDSPATIFQKFQDRIMAIPGLEFPNPPASSDTRPLWSLMTCGYTTRTSSQVSLYKATSDSMQTGNWTIPNLKKWSRRNWPVPPGLPFPEHTILLYVGGTFGHPTKNGHHCLGPNIYFGLDAVLRPPERGNQITIPDPPTELHLSTCPGQEGQTSLAGSSSTPSPSTSTQASSELLPSTQPRVFHARARPRSQTMEEEAAQSRGPSRRRRLSNEDEESNSEVETEEETVAVSRSLLRRSATPIPESRDFTHCDYESLLRCLRIEVPQPRHALRMTVPAHLELSTVRDVLLNWLSIRLGFNSNINYHGIIMERAYPLGNLLAGPMMAWWWFGEGAGPGITREILSTCIDNMLLDETFWVGTTDNQMTLWLSTLRSREVRVRRVKVFGTLTAIYIAQIGTVPPLLSLAFLQASLKGSSCYVTCAATSTSTNSAKSSLR
ncbi:nwd2 [Moniliophthora roreri]|nr:nwd2 [Moniliophthora roreri]